VDVAQGEQGETGGFIELSGHETISFEGEAITGDKGTFLIDPATLTINDALVNSWNTTLQGGGTVTGQAESLIEASTLLTITDFPLAGGPPPGYGSAGAKLTLLIAQDGTGAPGPALPSGNIVLDNLTIQMAGQFSANAGFSTGIVQIGSGSEIAAGDIFLEGGADAGGRIQIDGLVGGAGFAAGVVAGNYPSVSMSAYQIDINNNVYAYMVDFNGFSPVFGNPTINFSAGAGGFKHNFGSIIASSDIVTDSFEDPSDPDYVPWFSGTSGPAGTLTLPYLQTGGTATIGIDSVGDVNLFAPFVSLGPDGAEPTASRAISGGIAAIGADATLAINSGAGNINIGDPTVGTGPLIAVQGDYGDPFTNPLSPVPGGTASLNLNAAGSINILPAATPIFDKFSPDGEVDFETIEASAWDSNISFTAGSVNFQLGNLLGAPWGPSVNAEAANTAALSVFAATGDINVSSYLEAFTTLGTANVDIDAAGTVRVIGPDAAIEAWGEFDS
jgi:hypothetical protein